MNSKQCNAMQRAIAREALGRLRSIGEWFGTEDETTISSDYAAERMQAWMAWDDRVSEFERWIFDESPLA